MRNILLLVLCFGLTFTIQAQDRTVSGKVIDDSGEPVPGANVILKGTANGTTTSLDGTYRLTVPGNGGTLVYSFIGMVSQEAEIGSRSVVDITMKSDVTELQEVVVTALGVARDKKALGFAVQEVESKALTNSGAVSAVDALVGKAAGVQITRSSGSAGGGSRILIRGVTSMVGNNQPLIVIDGVRTNNDSNNSDANASATNTNGTATSNRLMDLNVEDIETVSVLKGAAATALYGTAGASGVLVITTKKGQKGSGLRVNFTNSVAFDNITRNPKLQNIYAQGTNGSYRDPSTGSSGSWGPRISDLEYATDPNHENAPGSRAFDADGNYLYDNNGFLVPAGTGNGTRANTYDNLNDFYQTGTTISNSLSIQGGNEVATFRFSFSNHDQEGIIPNEEYNRRTIGLASTLQATEKLSFAATINYARSDLNRIQQGSNTSGLLLGLYRTPISFDNSNGFGFDAVDQPSSYIFANGAQRNYRGGGGYDNPYWVINNALRDEQVNRVFGSFKVNYAFSDWLNLSVNVGTDVTNDIREQNFEINSRTNPNGQVFTDDYTTTQTDIIASISGQGQLSNEFALNYTGGINVFTYNDRNSYTQGDGLTIQGFEDISNASTISSIEDDTRYRQLGIFGQVEGSWRNTVFLTVSARQDYDSRLVVPGKEFSAGDVGFFYPSVSLSYAFTEMIPDNNILSFGKFRASWAQVGGPPPFAYLTSTPYETNAVGDGWGPTIAWPIGGQTSFELDNQLGNPQLTPELSTTVEFGLDLRFLNGKVGLDVTYFNRETEDAILNASLPRSTGYSSVWQNAGILESKGWEITLNATPVSVGDFQWNTQINWTKNESIVKQLAPGIERLFLAGFNSAGSYLVTGNQYGAIFGGAYLREDAGTDRDTDLNIPGGQIVINSDPSSSEYGYQLVDQTQRAIGNPNPDWIAGWNNTFTYKRFTAGFLIDWRQGGDLWNGTAWALSFFGRSQLTAETRGEVPVALPGVINVGDADNPSYVANNIPVVRDQNYWQSSLGGFGAVGEQFVQDGGWVRLREVSVSYALPGTFFGQSFIKGGSIGFIGRNLWFTTEYDGVDPETSLTGTGNGQGFDYFNQPSTKTALFKLSLNF